MIKSVMPVLGLALLASVAHADGTISVRPTIGASDSGGDAPVILDHDAGRLRAPACKARRSTAKISSGSIVDFEPKFQVMCGRESATGSGSITSRSIGREARSSPNRSCSGDVVLQPGDPLQSELDRGLRHVDLAAIPSGMARS